jgi:hypothetical protein
MQEASLQFHKEITEEIKWHLQVRLMISEKAFQCLIQYILGSLQT